ncbi:MAG: DUF1471 domain-containing protein [Balneolaceae bacterium]|nr:DUF1471 domain-containing protein [Balneolaceae bacterium]
MKSRLLFLFALFVFASCAEVNYIGQSYEPTTEVEIFYDEKAIEFDYTIIGQAIGSSSWFNSIEDIQDEMIKTAKRKGADGIIITGIDTERYNDGDSSSKETQVKAVFFKYD